MNNFSTTTEVRSLMDHILQNLIGPLVLLRQLSALVIAVFSVAMLATAAANDVVQLKQADIDELVAPILQWHPRVAVAIDVRSPGVPNQFFACRGEKTVAKEPDPDSIFQIGSVTKVFTCLLLAIAAEQDELRLSDPASGLLPTALALPKRGIREITLEELATHTSGLPRLPPDFVLALSLGLVSSQNPYATLNERSIARGLGFCSVDDEEFPKYAYSNLGMGLLGHALCHRANLDYETLLKQRITAPLGMSDTVLALNDDQKSRFFVGHEPTGKELPAWKFGMLEGAGGLYSTTNDLHLFLAAESGQIASPLEAAMKLTQVPRRDVTENLKIGLGWHIFVNAEHPICWHDGATMGHTSFVAMCHDPAVSIVVLCNQGVNPLSGQTIANRIGFPLLKKLTKLSTPSVEHSEDVLPAPTPATDSK